MGIAFCGNLLTAHTLLSTNAGGGPAENTHSGKTPGSAIVVLNSTHLLRPL
jgi:hypothetical protein